MSNQPLFHKVESFWRVQQTALILLFLFLTACTVLVQRWCSMLAHGLIPQWLTHPFFRPWCHMFYSSLAPLAGVLHWTAVQKSLSSPVSRRRFIDTRSGSELSKQFSPYFYSANIYWPNLSYITYPPMGISVLIDQLRCFSKMSLVIFGTQPPLPRRFFFFSTVSAGLPPPLWSRVGSDKHKRTRLVTDLQKL